MKSAGKSFGISAHGLFKGAILDLVKLGKVEIEENILATYQKNALLDLSQEWR